MVLLEVCLMLLEVEVWLMLVVVEEWLMLVVVDGTSFQYVKTYSVAHLLVQR